MNIFGQVRRVLDPARHAWQLQESNWVRNLFGLGLMMRDASVSPRHQLASRAWASSACTLHPACCSLFAEHRMPPLKLLQPLSICMMQERLAPSAVTHRISTLHPYNTRQQTGLASQQVNICQIMPGKCTRTENNCDCAQAVMKCLKRCCDHNVAGVRRCSKRQYAQQTRVV